MILLCNKNCILILQMTCLCQWAHWGLEWKRLPASYKPKCQILIANLWYKRNVNVQKNIFIGATNNTTFCWRNHLHSFFLWKYHNKKSEAITERRGGGQKLFRNLVALHFKVGQDINSIFGLESRKLGYHPKMKVPSELNLQLCVYMMLIIS